MDDFRVIPEEGDDRRREHHGKDCQDADDDFRGDQSEPVTLPDTVVSAGAVAVCRDRLVPLADAEDKGKKEHGYASVDGHGRDRCIAIGPGTDVEERGPEHTEELTDQTRHSVSHDPEDRIRFPEFDVPGGEMADRLPSQEHGEQEQERDGL